MEISKEPNSPPEHNRASTYSLRFGRSRRPVISPVPTAGRAHNRSAQHWSFRHRRTSPHLAGSRIGHGYIRTDRRRPTQAPRYLSPNRIWDKAWSVWVPLSPSVPPLLTQEARVKFQTRELAWLAAQTLRPSIQPLRKERLMTTLLYQLDIFSSMTSSRPKTMGCCCPPPQARV